MDEDPIVVLTTAPNEPLAQMWVEALREAAIVAMAKPLGPGMGAWGSVATFEHELWVRRSQLDQARELLAEIDEGEVAE